MITVEQLFDNYLFGKMYDSAQTYLEKDGWIYNGIKIQSLTYNKDKTYTINNEVNVSARAKVERPNIYAQIEEYAKLWNRTHSYRFYFVYHRFNYQIVIKFGNKEIKNGIVYGSDVHITGSCLYSGRFKPLELSFDTSVLEEFAYEIADEISVVEEQAQIEFEATQKQKKTFTPETVLKSLTFNPNSCLIMPKASYTEAKALASAIDIKETQRTKIIAKLAQFNFWATVKGRVLGGSNHIAQEKLTAHFIYAALQSKQAISIETIIEQIENLPESPEKESYRTGLRLAKKNYVDQELVVIDWKA